MKPIAHLPDDVVSRLKTLKETNQPEFEALLLGLRAAGWPLRTIADPFDVTRVSAKNWETKALSNGVTPATDVPPLPLDVRGVKVRAKRIPPDVPSKDRVKIAELSKRARSVRRWTLPNSDEQKAANELREMLIVYVLERGVTTAAFARYAGVSRRAIVQRLDKIKDDILAS
jgi:hypothetical protein